MAKLSSSFLFIQCTLAALYGRRRNTAPDPKKLTEERTGKQLDERQWPNVLLDPRVLAAEEVLRSQGTIGDEVRREDTRFVHLPNENICFASDFSVSCPNVLPGLRCGLHVCAFAPSAPQTAITERVVLFTAVAARQTWASQ